MEHLAVAPDLRRSPPAAPVTGDDADPLGAGRLGETDVSGTSWRPADFEAVQHSLAMLARAVRYFQSYPATSSFCVDAIAATQAALVGLTSREQLAFRVGPTYVLVDEIVTVTGGGVERDIARRLHRAQVATVTIARTATTSDLTRFCIDVSSFRESARSIGTFASYWGEQRVDTITVRPAHRPVVIEADMPRELLQRLVEREHQHRQAVLAGGGPVQHLYPPDKGWVLVDPSVTYDSLSLADLALLLEDPSEVAVAMLRLADEERAATIDRQTAFSEKFSELASLFASVDPQISRALFANLANSLLELDVTRRTALLKHTVLPGLLDATMDGAILASFPDVELADALCLLLDLEAAAPEVLTTAIDRLGLTSERRATLEPMLRGRLGTGGVAVGDADHGHDRAIDRFANKLIELDPNQGRSFGEYAAFDLTVTDQTHDTLIGIVEHIAATDGTEARLETLVRLIRLESNPSVVAGYLQRVEVQLAGLEQQGRWSSVAEWGGRLRVIEAELRPSRAEASALIATGLHGFWTLRRLTALADRYTNQPDGKGVADALVHGFGAALPTAIIAGLDDTDAAHSARTLLPLVEDHAAAVAPLLASRLPAAKGTTRLEIIRLLGLAGPNYAAKVASLLATSNDEISREVLRALIRMGGSAAATAITRHIVAGPAASRTDAVEALLRFPPAVAQARVRELLANRVFVMRQPEIVGQLLDVAVRVRVEELAPALKEIASLRFRFWNPALVRVARKASRLLKA